MERIPVLALGPVLVVSVQGDLLDSVAATLRDDAGERVAAGPAPAPVASPAGGAGS